ncbi:iron-sulfur cluster assembly accessory protein [Brevundimonas basaltis]|uniref:Iron-sulfur cluster assembly protein n=1 Tax=Brevundimonas basaltis TaxID=472166 RepID=A0A7W8MFF3_9CAUL|nr:iron-sulfur cluster assembly accessory protein [Brevundimonas basaltis]MBB5290835.1 iron-sulfur cluster assembly protein [Brevundimonas basaltis]
MSELQTTPRQRRPRPAVVTLTEAAAERVRALTEAGGHKGLRVGVKNAGCAGQEYTFALADEIGPLEEVVTDKGATVVIDPKAILFLIGSEIDYETTKLASKFVFRNPNQTDACGCGESVTIVPAAARDDSQA